MVQVEHDLDFPSATCLYFVSCLAEISPIVPVNQPFSPYYRYGLGSGRGYASSSLPFSSSPYGTLYGSSYPITAGYGTVGYSGYEGPGGGYSNYLQPAISYPPLGITSRPHSPSQNPFTKLPKFSGLVGSPTLSMAGDCQDQSSQCALWASTGQCATSAEYVRRVCPQSCGTGCLSNTISSYGTLSPGYGLRSGYDVYGTMPKYGLDLGSTLFGSAAHGLGPGYGIDSLLNPLYKNDIGGSLNPFLSRYGYNSVINNGFPSVSTNETPLFCRDSHIEGCAVWASNGLCQTTSAFMLRYCRGSCGLCPTIAAEPSDTPISARQKHISYILGHGAGGVIGPGYGSDSTFGPYGLASGYGLDPLYGLNYGLGSGLSSNGLGLMDGLISSYGIGSGLGSALGLYSGRGLIADDGLGARPIMNPLYGYGSGYNLGLGSGFDMNGLHSGYGLYGNDYYGGLGAYRSGIYPYSLKEKKASTLKSTDRDEKYHEGRATLTRITGTRRQ
ncbi:unnamed protein product [Toxocara canis]|uniref:ShKT domain-containing protein n=1 Tax=Toxocara canis TaxID=6265 RepID=A0A183UUM1_TOXCA|nr:unnamed protein product [Toxocara canis]